MLRVIRPFETAVMRSLLLIGSFVLFLGLFPVVHADQQCLGGPNEGQACKTDADCPNGACAGFKPPPQRLSEGKPINANLDCPPGVRKCFGGTRPGELCREHADCGEKGLCKLAVVVPADEKLGDARVGGDPNKLDYFMGEWKYVQGRKDLIVRKWCIDGAFFSLQILTSLDGKINEDPRKQIAPGTPT